MYRAALLLLFAGCLFDPVYACLNQSGTTLDGGSVRHGVSPGLQLRSYLNREVKSSGEKMELELRDKQDRKSLNDYGVALVYQGRTEEAISFLKEQEKSNPGDYSTAANLGTAYELAGKNELALKWIQEGMHRNPKSHQGTEWVHVKILEAKMQQEKNPDYFKEHSVLNLDPNKIKNDSPLLETDGAKLSSRAVGEAIHYQLQERLQFVKTRDPSVASLLFDYGAILAVTDSVEHARQLMAMAVEFGFPSEKVLPFYKQFDHAISVRNTKANILYGSIGILVVAFFIYAFKRRWIVYRRSAPVSA